MFAHFALQFYHSFVANVADLVMPRSTALKHSPHVQSVQAITSQLSALYNIVTAAVRTAQKTHLLTSLPIVVALPSKLPALPKRYAVKSELKPLLPFETDDNRHVKNDNNPAQTLLLLVNPVSLTLLRLDATLPHQP